MMSNPPGIVASLLPAPEQAILNANFEKSFATLYRPDEQAAVVQSQTTSKESFAGARANLEVEEEEEDADSGEEIEDEDENGEADDDDEDSDQE